MRHAPDFLESRTPKRYFSGTHRAAPPQETWERIEPLLPAFGVTRVADITGLDRIGVAVATAIRPLSRSIAVAAGKGVNLIAAKVSAAMEAIECAHAERIDRPLFFGSRADLARTQRVIDPTSLPLLGGAVVDDQTPLLWIEGRTIADGGSVLVPYELVHAHYCPFALPGSAVFNATTNGLSSGNVGIEAICHGLFEVIERDALNLWSRLSRSERIARRLHLSFDGSPVAEQTTDQLVRKGFKVAVWNITSDTQVPAFHCVIVDDLEPGGQPGTGTGCHPDKDIALSRALFEAIQVRGTYISGGRDDLARRDYDVDKIADLRRMLEQDPIDSVDNLHFSDLPSHHAEYFEDDARWAINRLEDAGCGPPIVVDLSLTGSGLSVVRVVVPGLEGPLAPNVMPGIRARRHQA